MCHTLRYVRTHRAAAVLLLILSAARAVGAQDAPVTDTSAPTPAPPELCPCPPPEPPPPLWTGSLGLSYLATTGNSESENLGLSAAFARQPTPWGLELAALTQRAETDGEKTAERIFASARALRAFGERLEGFAGLSHERDEFAGFDARTVVESGALWRALVGPVHELAFDAGLTWTDEEPTTGGSDEFLGAVAGVAYAWKLSETAAFRQRVVAYPSFDDSDDWRLRSETSLEAALASAWALRLGYLFTRDNQPPVGFDKDDGATSVSLVWKR